MPPIYLGSTPITKMYLGVDQLSAAYLGVQALISSVSYKPIENIVLLGASIENRIFSGASDYTAFSGYLAEAIPGAVCTIRNESVDGRTSNALFAAWPAIKAKYIPAGVTPLPTDERVLFVIHCHGNDVTNMRPYGASDDAAIALYLTGMQSLVNDIAAQGWDWHIQDPTWRDYGNIGFESEELGMKPYLSRMSRAAATNNAQPYKNRQHPNGQAWLDWYSILLDNSHILADQIHPNPVDAATSILKKSYIERLIAPSYSGTAPSVLSDDIPTSDAVGDFAVFSLGDLLKTWSPNATKTVFYALNQASGLAKNRSTGARMRWFTRSIVVPSGVNTTSNPALSVPGYFSGKEFSEAMYCNSAVVASFAIKNLTPGGSYELVFSGSRNIAAADTSRTTQVRITTGTPDASPKYFNAANPASGTTAGSCTFTVTPDANGLVVVEWSSYDRATQYGYLSAFSVKRLS